MEAYLPISFLNDFSFCPRSIYFHQLHGQLSRKLYHTVSQRHGLAAHQSIDKQTYSTAKRTLQGMAVHSEIYRLNGKIDIFHQHTQELIERKNKIKIIYDGYRFQLYAQYHCLSEMGYRIKSMKLYSIEDNKNYPIKIPPEDISWQIRFEKLLESIRSFSLNDSFTANPQKCKRCIYRHLCDQDQSDTA